MENPELRKRLNQIIEKQRRFQKLCGKQIDTKDSFTKSFLSEMYLFKAIEEVVELRKTFPSALNESAKIQPEIDRTELLKEYSDVILFLINFGILWGISDEELLGTIEMVQANNFRKKLDSIENQKNEFIEEIKSDEK